MWQIYAFIWNFLKGGKGNKEMVWMNLKSESVQALSFVLGLKKTSENVKTSINARLFWISIKQYSKDILS